MKPVWYCARAKASWPVKHKKETENRGLLAEAAYRIKPNLVPTHQEMSPPSSWLAASCCINRWLNSFDLSHTHFLTQALARLLLITGLIKQIADFSYPSAARWGRACGVAQSSSGNATDPGKSTSLCMSCDTEASLFPARCSLSLSGLAFLRLTAASFLLSVPPSECLELFGNAADVCWRGAACASQHGDKSPATCQRVSVSNWKAQAPLCPW